MSMNLRLMLVALLIETVPLGIDNRLKHFESDSHPLGTHRVRVECITLEVPEEHDPQEVIKGAVRILINPNNPFIRSNERIVRSDFKLLSQEDVEHMAYSMGMSYKDDLNHPMRLMPYIPPVVEPATRSRWELLEMDDHHEEEEQPEPTLAL